MTPRRTITILSLILGLAFAYIATQIPTLTHAPATYWRHVALTATLPGILLSHAITPDAQQAPPYAAPVATFLFYFFLSWITGQLLLRLLPKES